ncbi:MAG: SlyX family protein [Haliea sp.]|tara:strand:+ start:100245 stop:100469 length:225 start_codon:yes stop_codon:yes gene_type:complete
MKKKELQKQLEYLQSQAAFQEDALQALQSALALQQQDLLTLRRQLTLLKQRQDEQAQQAEEGAPVPSHEVPPHY